MCSVLCSRSERVSRSQEQVRALTSALAEAQAAAEATGATHAAQLERLRQSDEASRRALHQQEEVRLWST